MVGGGAAGAAGRPDVILVITRRIWGNLRPDNNWDCHNRMIPTTSQHELREISTQTRIAFLGEFDQDTSLQRDSIK